jgi:hypothetical protein
MDFVGHDNYVVVVLTVGGFKALDIKLILKRETRTRTTFILPVRSYLTKNMSTLPFVNYFRKLALLCLSRIKLC